MNKTIRRIRTLWWLSGVITEWPPIVKGDSPIRIMPTASLSNGEIRITYKAKA